MKRFRTGSKFDYAHYFKEGFARVKLNEKYGFIKTDGSYLVEPKFDDVRGYGLGRDLTVEFNRKWGKIDINGVFYPEN